MANLLPRLEFLLQAMVSSRKSCPHCRSPLTRVVARKFGVVRVRRCDSCVLWFTDPQYQRGLAGNLYDNIYSAEGSTTALPGAHELEELRHRCFAGTDKDFRERLRRMRRASPGHRLLELGCSWGYFLHQARDAGYDVQGVEIGGPRRRFAVEKLDLAVVKRLSQVPRQFFDVVYTTHVLEHFLDVSTVFDELREVLRPGGRLLLEVPHFDWEERGKPALALVGAVHPLGFTSEFFRRNLPRHGLRVLGFLDRWEDLGNALKPESRGDSVICVAEREVEP